MKPEIIDAVRVIRCLNLFWYNSSPYDIILKLFNCEVGDSYFNEQQTRYHEGVSKFMSSMDVAHQTKYVQMALDKYWDETGRMF